MNNILKNWNLRRILYLLGGIFFVVASIKDQFWIILPFGLYFIAMAVFRFGCAKASCTVSSSPNKN